MEPKALVTAGGILSIIMTIAAFVWMKVQWIPFSFNINDDVIFPVQNNLIRFRNAVFTTAEPIDVTSILNGMAVAHTEKTPPANFKLVGKLSPYSFKGGVTGFGATLRGEYKKL